MEQALRAVERMAEEQQMRIEELQRGQMQLAQALSDIRAAKARSSAEPDVSRSNPQLRRRTPPPTMDEPSRTPRTEGSSRTPRSQQAEPLDTDGSRMVRNNTEPSLHDSEHSVHTKHYKRYRDDPRYRETGKQYGPWPPYPDWQDLPLRRFGMGFGKKGIGKDNAGAGGPSHIQVGGDMKEESKRTQHGDQQLVGGMVRGIGHGRRKFDHIGVNTDHFDHGFVPLEGKDVWGRPVETDELTGFGKHHYYVKDHLNDEWSSTVTGGSSRSGQSRRRSEGSSRSSGSRSAR